ncbi:MAG: hypothetical protein ABIQ59_08760 [Nocardioidaceae bacterium]
MSRTRPARTRLARALALAACLAAGTTACTGDPAPPAAARTAPPLRLVASVAQFRFDEGTRHLKAGVTNHSDRQIRVSQATIVWDGLAFPTVPVGGGAVLPGQTAAFTISYGAPQCSQPPATKPVLVAVVDGRTTRLPLQVEDPQLLVRLHAKACAAQRLDEVASVDLRLSTATETVRGEEYLPGHLVLRRRPGATGRVRLVDLGGSVLLELVPRSGGAPRAALAGDRQVLDYQVLLGSAHRCDPHALSQSSQTFLLSAYVRVGDDPTQRVILPVTSAERDRLFGILHRDCS